MALETIRTQLNLSSHHKGQVCRRGCPIVARERQRAGNKQMATHEAVVQTQNICLIAARERPRDGSRQMVTYQAVTAQTQSRSSSCNGSTKVCCCCCFSHSAYWLPTRKSRSWSAEQGKENKIKRRAAYPPPHPPHCSFGENK